MQVNKIPLTFKMKVKMIMKMIVKMKMMIEEEDYRRD